MKWKQKVDSYTFGMVSLFYKKNNKRTLKKAEFREEIEISYQAGMMAVCDLILESEKNNPASNKDEFIGDIHFLLSDLWNDYAKKYKHENLTPEELINYKGVSPAKLKFKN